MVLLYIKNVCIDYGDYNYVERCEWNFFVSEFVIISES